MQHERILRLLESANANLQSSLSAAQRQLKISQGKNRALEDLQAQLKAKEAKEKGKSNLLNSRKILMITWHRCLWSSTELEERLKKAAEELNKMAAERTDLAKAKAEAEQAKSQLSAELEGTT